MPVIDIDHRERMTIPKEMSLRGNRTAIIPTGSFPVIMPIIGDPHKAAGS